MATKKKPAKPIAGQSRDTSKNLPGKAVMYMTPAKGAALFECPTCRRSLSKGIVYEVGNAMYCKRGCIPSQTEGNN
jgi:hypothetical protein